LQGQSGDGALPPHGFALTLHYADSGETVHARLHTDSLGLLLAAGLVSRLAPLDAPADLSTLPVPMQLSLGEASLPLGLLRQLVPGDVVFIASRLVPADGQLLLNVRTPDGRLGLPVQVHDTQLTVLDHARLHMPQQLSSADPQPFHWDQLPILLSFDLGEKTLALGELQHLQPGETLALERPVDKCVTIRANGAVIGSGELVDIDGRIGVSVVALNTAAPAFQERVEAGARDPDDDDEPARDRDRDDEYRDDDRDEYDTDEDGGDPDDRDED
jgi:type III secretion protein Q